MLGEGHGEREASLVGFRAPPGRIEDDPEDRAVRRMHDETATAPTAPEQLHVGVTATE